VPKTAQKAGAERYQVVPRTLIFLTHEGRVLLLKGASHKRLWANLYNGVGGHVERGEDVLTAARRELREETGLEASLWLCGVVTIDTGHNTGIGLFVFRGEPLLPLAPLRPSREGEARWVPLDAWRSLPLVEDLHVLLPRVLAAAPDTPPFFAQYTYDAEGRLQITFADAA